MTSRGQIHYNEPGIKEVLLTQRSDGGNHVSENKTIKQGGELSGPVNRWHFVRVLQLLCQNHICSVFGEQEEVIGGAETFSYVRAASL